MLIDLWRYGRSPRRLLDLTKKVGERAILVPWITRAEFSRGALFADVPVTVLADFFQGFHLLPLDEAAMNQYCLLWGIMAKAGRAVDYPDLWIAASAVSRGVPVLTRNPKHFERIPELDVVSYEIGSS